MGQVNGLSVARLANFEFGMPSRILRELFRRAAWSASTAGQAERPHPRQGAVDTSSYLLGKFANADLSVSASLTFEQNWRHEDSASSTELYALLSRLADVPIKQNLAVTESVNQLGGAGHRRGERQGAGFYDSQAARPDG